MFLFQRYGEDLPPVLHGVSFKLRARERVGLLGRTGQFTVHYAVRSLIDATFAQEVENLL